MKKICYITSVPGTINSFFVSQIKYLSENGYEIYVICSPDDSLQKILGSNIRFIPIEIPRGVNFIKMLKATYNLIKIFKKERFDLIQYSTPNASLCSAIAGRISRIKIRNYHLMGFRYLGTRGAGGLILKYLEKITCKLSTSIECVSKSNLKLGIEEGIFSEEKASVIWNGSTGGVDLKRFDYSKRDKWRREIRMKLGYSNVDFIYGFVGRITRDKGINEILEVFLEFKDESKLLLIGNFENENTLDKNLINKAMKDKNIKFHKSVIDIEKYFAAIDVLLLPSYREGFGNVIIEAAAMGTPAIVSNIPGPIDAIEKEKTALTVIKKDKDSLLNAMRKIKCEEYKDMGEKAYIFVKENFESNELNKKILERKKKILGEEQ